MSRRTEKQFTNDATTPMIVSVAACIDDNGIVRELNKRLPGWAEQPPGPVVYDTPDLIIRAIRTLNKHMRGYEELATAFAKELRKRVDLETENAALKKARRG